MATKLHFWDDGDRSVGIGSNQTTIELELDGHDEAETKDNIEHAKKVLSKVLFEIWVSIRTKTGSDSHPNTATDSRRKTATQQRQQMGESSVGLSGCSRPFPDIHAFHVFCVALPTFPWQDGSLWRHLRCRISRFFISPLNRRLFQTLDSVRLRGQSIAVHISALPCITARAALLNVQFDIMNTHFSWLYFALLLSSGAHAVESTEEYNEYTIRPEDIPRDAPKFEDFPVSPYTGPNAKLDLHGDRESRMFRTRLASWAKEKPNFAGHYILATWGCGANCYSISIIDAKTGRIYHPAGIRSNTFDNVHESLIENTLQFKLDSKLLVLIGAPEEDTSRRGISYYVWENNKEKRIRYIHKAWYPER